MKIHCKYDELLPLKEIAKLLNPKNRNKHPPDQVDAIVQQFEYQGIRHPIIISNRSNLVAAGEGRYLAAKQMGMATFPVSRQDFIDEEQEYAFGVADNAIALRAQLDFAGINQDIVNLGPDFDLSLLGIEGFTVDVADKYGDEDADAIPDTPKQAKSKPGDLFLLGAHRLLCGDSTRKEDVEKLMAGEKADVVVTSPPYADLREYDIGKFDWLALMNGAFDGMVASAGSDANFLVNLGQTHKDKRVNFYWDPWLKYAEGIGWPCFGLYIWDKVTAVPGDWNGRLAPRHEFIFHFTNSKRPRVEKWIECKGGEACGRKSTRQKDGTLQVGFNSPDKTGQSHKIPDSIIEVTCEKNNKTGHPAVYPVRFAEFLLKTYSLAGAVTYEPFTGSGSTLIACEKTNRKCYGMEIDPFYCDVILDRFHKFSGIEPIREDGRTWSQIKAEA